MRSNYVTYSKRVKRFLFTSIQVAIFNLVPPAQFCFVFLNFSICVFMSEFIETCLCPVLAPARLDFTFYKTYFCSEPSLSVAPASETFTFSLACQ